ncbi:MAG: hypothetical protein JO022_03580 [Acidobacteriaceae bacterium]|nr:hypothetical protein [Acidobacteriaceae bacterium]
MATLAILNTLIANRTLVSAGEQTTNYDPDHYLLRPIASEDIFYYSKYIDNARMVRKADPKVRRAQGWMISASLCSAILLVALMLPSLYTAFSGYQLESLRQENARLSSEIATLSLQEEKILSPQHIEELSHKQAYIDPDPANIVYLEGKRDAVAKRMAFNLKEQAR